MFDGDERPDGPRGWLVAVAGAVAMVFTFGTAMSYAIFRGPLSATFGLSPLALSGVFALMLGAFFIGSGIVGIFASRFPARPLLLGCAVATAAVAPALYVVDSLAGLVVAFSVLGLALGTQYVLVAAIVPRWFEARRGVATGLIFVGNGLGLFVLPPLWEFALSAVGLRRGFLVILGATAVAFLLTGLLCRRPAWTERSSAGSAELIEWVRALARRRSFKLVFVGVTLCFAWYQLFAAYAVDLFAARGLTRAGASLAFGAVGGISILSRFGGGYLADLIGVRRAYLAFVVCTALGVAVLFAPTLLVLAVAVTLLGLGLGGIATLYIPLLMGLYPPERDTAIVGVFNVGVGVAALAMPPVGTATVTLTGGFGVALLVTLLVLASGLVTVAVGTAETPNHRSRVHPTESE